MDTTCAIITLLKFLCPTIASKNSSFFLLSDEKKWGFDFGNTNFALFFDFHTWKCHFTCPATVLALRSLQLLIKCSKQRFVPHNSRSKLWFFPLIRGEKWGFDFGILISHVSLISTHESVTSRVPQLFWRFGVRNVSLIALGGTLFLTSYNEMEILWLAFLLKFWAG